MRLTSYLWLALASTPVMISSAQAAQHAVPPSVGNHSGTAVDHEAIERLLGDYTKSVADGDERRFESLLLQPDIPFSSTRGVQQRVGVTGHADTRNFSNFKAAIFDSGHHFRQRFFNVQIEQVGQLAQVSLDYLTADQSTGQTSYGWKVLQLLKINGEWKIASEFFTGYAPVDPRVKE